MKRSFRLPGGAFTVCAVDWKALMCYVYPSVFVPSIGSNAAPAMMALIKVAQQVQLYELTKYILPDEIFLDLTLLETPNRWQEKSNYKRII
jgi:hypothetical protein